MRVPGPYRPYLGTILTTALWLIATPPDAGAWTGTLSNGAEIQVDPNTHRAIRTDGDRPVPMWDGVHRMDDGSVVIIRDGNAVPTEQMLETWQGSPQPLDRLAGRPCEQLERLVCGDDNACRSSADCYKVRSMLNAERDARRRLPMGADDAGTMAESQVCESALKDQIYPPCTQSQSAGGPSPCQLLVARVCGSGNECADSTACPPARQLLRQEAAERAGRTGEDVGTPSGEQCAEAMQNSFFTPCARK